MSNELSGRWREIHGIETAFRTNGIARGMSGYLTRKAENFGWTRMNSSVVGETMTLRPMGQANVQHRSFSHLFNATGGVYSDFWDRCHNPKAAGTLANKISAVFSPGFWREMRAIIGNIENTLVHWKHPQATHPPKRTGQSEDGRAFFPIGCAGPVRVVSVLGGCRGGGVGPQTEIPLR